MARNKSRPPLAPGPPPLHADFPAPWELLGEFSTRTLTSFGTTLGPRAPRLRSRRLTRGMNDTWGLIEWVSPRPQREWMKEGTTPFLTRPSLSPSPGGTSVGQAPSIQPQRQTDLKTPRAETPSPFQVTVMKGIRNITS